MSKVIVYLLSGKSENGKDAIYEACKTNYNWTKVAFANKLKHTVADLYNFSNEQMFGSLRNDMDKRYPNLIDQEFLNPLETSEPFKRNTDYLPFLTPRRVLQIFGQQQRSLFPDIWASYLFASEIPKLAATGVSRFVVTDLRFQNEIVVANRFQTEDFKVVKVRINRPGVKAKSGSNDISEMDLDAYSDWDYVIENTGSLQDLKAKGLKMLLEVEESIGGQEGLYHTRSVA